MNDHLKNLKRPLDWKFFITMGLTLAGILVPVWLSQVEQQARSMVLQQVSVASLYPQSVPTVKDLRMTLNGQELDSPYLTVFDLKNNGSRPIPQADFEVPIAINAKEPVRVVSVELASVKPNDLKPIISINDGAITIQPLLLNPNDTLRMTAVTIGGNPEFSIRGRISGIQRIDIEDKTTTSELRSRFWKGAVVGAVLLILAVGQFTEFFFPLYDQRRFLPKPFIMSVTMIIGGTGLLFPLIEMYSLSPLQVTIILAVTYSIAIPFNLGILRNRRHPE